jgi:LacI family purine nucleotide synthesis repressor
MPSIKDVAARAGVSLSTVSIIINNKAEERKITKETQQKVLHAIEELGYSTNIAAKKLKLGTAQIYTIALFWTFDFRRGMLTRFFMGLQERMRTSDFPFNIVIYPYTTGELHKEMNSFTGGYFHAAVIANASPNDLRFLEKQTLSVPVVIYNRFSERFSSVNINDNRIGELAAKHLLTKGYSRPLVVGSHSSFPGATVRRHAFVGTMLDKGVAITPDEMVYVDNDAGGGYEYVMKNIELLKEKNIDSFFCDSDAIGLGLQSALVSQGISVPGQCGVIAIGNGDPQYSMYSTPSLTVIDIPMHLMASSCCDLLLNAQRQSGKPKEEIYFETKIYPRQSTDR